MFTRDKHKQTGKTVAHSTSARASVGGEGGMAFIDLTEDGGDDDGGGREDDDEDDQDEEEDEDDVDEDDDDCAATATTTSATRTTPSMTLSQALAMNIDERERAGRASKLHNVKITEQLNITTGELLRIYPSGKTSESPPDHL